MNQILEPLFLGGLVVAVCPFDSDEGVACAGHAAAHQHDVALGVDLHDPETAGGHFVVAHVARHARALPDSAR